ncbi:hypothetical protein DV737_g4803, partial [Chaetothyriales sp. CBS 132003]
MGRRLFLQHLALATVSPASINSVHSPDEAVVALTFSYVGQSSPQSCNIRLLALNIDKYPDANHYMIFTEDDHIDPALPKSFELISPRLLSSPIPEALATISSALTDLVTKGLAANPSKLDTEQQPVVSSCTVTLDKIKRDLRATRNAGFRVGIIGDLVTGGIATVSTRVTKLGLSDEAMRAWGLQTTHYLVLLIRFRQGYRHLEQIASDATLNSHTQVRVALCKSYKPSDYDARDAFDHNTQNPRPGMRAPTLEPLFIGTPLNDLFRERFSSIVRFRQLYGFNWPSAEAMAHDFQAKASQQDDIDLQRYALPDDAADRALLPVVIHDALHHKPLKDASLPLVAMQFLLRHFVPFGIDLKVPLLPQYNDSLLYHRPWAAAVDKQNAKAAINPTFSARIDFDSSDMIFSPDQNDETASLRPGDWLIVRNADMDHDYHYQVQETIFPIWRLSKPIITKPAIPRQKFGLTLPELSADSSAPGGSTPPADASCKRIQTVYCYAYDANFDDLIDEQKSPRVSGMDGWLQFRFAQGAPDKEQRFVDCVKKESPGAKYPTLFARHGSPLSNWHSIIRQGLRFDEALHGRTYGNGVYMSNQACTSVWYTGLGALSRGSDTANLKWPRSILGVANALSLEEVVNKTDAFLSKLPHYVVADTDWIQTRYLFIKSDLKHSTASSTVVAYDQDPQHQCYNGTSQPIQIPVTAVSKSRRPAPSPTAINTGFKKIKHSPPSADEQIVEKQGDDADSVMSDVDDGTFLNNIKFLDPPKDASISATNSLQRALKEAVKVQNTTPLSTLAWYINSDHFSNLYQWIIQLHSFNEKLPLAKDMKRAGIVSIVLEMRFTNQFPFSPPFIRVVKPRFLPFSAVGGGHVTQGGASCMEFLTNTGWTAVTSIEMVLLHVQLAMSDEERPVRLANASI